MDENSTYTAHILVVDDDTAITKLVEDTLEPEGFKVTGCANGREALEAFESHAYDLVILDIMMPGMDGFETCQHIRALSSSPVIFLSAKDEEADKVIGFTLGADDYIVKPFKPREFVARIKARLRRHNEPQVASTERLSAAGIELDLYRHEAFLYCEPLELTPKEFDILALLLRNEGRPVSAKELFESTWHEEYRSTDSNTIMVHIRRLRKKLSAIDSSHVFIETIFGVGYRIDNGRS